MLAMLHTRLHPRQIEKSKQLTIIIINAKHDKQNQPDLNLRSTTDVSSS